MLNFEDKYTETEGFVVNKFAMVSETYRTPL